MDELIAEHSWQHWMARPWVESMDIQDEAKEWCFPCLTPGSFSENLRLYSDVDASAPDFGNRLADSQLRMSGEVGVVKSLLKGSKHPPPDTHTPRKRQRERRGCRSQCVARLASSPKRDSSSTLKGLQSGSSSAAGAPKCF